MAREGVEPEEICRRLEEIIPMVDTTFVIDQLDYLYKGGRCSGLEAELNHYASAYRDIDRERLARVMPVSAVNVKDKPTKKDWSEWLAVHIPALQGSESDKMWIKYVLRGISRISAMTA